MLDDDDASERSPIRVLLVEDNDDDAFFIEDVLQDGLDVAGSDPEPVTLVRCETLTDAKSKAGNSDVVLLDLSLPDSNGLDTFTELRAAAPELPIVVLSGRDEAQLGVDCVKQGAQDYLSKNTVDGATVSRALRYAVLRSSRVQRPRAGQERFVTALEQSAEALLVLDLDGRLLYANPRAIAGFGLDYTPEPGTKVGSESPVAWAGDDVDATFGHTVWDGRLARLVTLDTPDETPQPGPRLDVNQPLIEGYDFEGLMSASPTMRSVFATCERVSPSPATVLLLGETGTGKELIARAIHARSARKGPFVAVNCGAVPESLIEAELFGHEKGAFTGANESKPGLFRQANGGTLLLDEVADLSSAAQVSLLRTLQEQKVRPVGGASEIPVNVRVIAATSGDLFQKVERGAFRSDLLYRLDVIRVEVPSLRDRPEDVIHLLGHFLRQQSERYGMEAPEMSSAFLQAALEFPWPGNVRQLQNLAERVVLTAPECMTGRQFHELVRPYQPASVGTQQSGAGVDAEALADTYDNFMDHMEKLYFEELLRRSSGRVQEGATLADISRRTLLRKMKKHRLDKDEFR
ncbi:MAG: sigma-54 dependent transcriptional regulator [Planctomycetota bacterium]